MVDNTSTSSGNGNGKKRKYRRHPKRDKNAPKRPPSAYIMFSNDMRAKINDKSKTFTEMAKTIGELWKNLDPNKKQAYELEAMKAKDAYQIAMQQYRKTSEHKVMIIIHHADVDCLTCRALLHRNISSILKNSNKKIKTTTTIPPFNKNPNHRAGRR